MKTPHKIGDTRPSGGIPAAERCAYIYTDDSGVKPPPDVARHILVIGGIKTRKNGELMRAVRHIRDLDRFEREFKFRTINKGSASAYYAMIDALEKSDAMLIGTVAINPDKLDWRHHARLTSGLVHGNVNRNEVVTLLMDAVSTPRGVAFEDIVRGRVNSKLGSQRVTGAVTLDSRTCDGLQIADLVAGAIAFDRRRRLGGDGRVDSLKGRVVERLKAAFGVDTFDDVRTDRVNVQTWHPPLPKEVEKVAALTVRTGPANVLAIK